MQKPRPTLVYIQMTEEIVKKKWRLSDSSAYGYYRKFALISSDKNTKRDINLMYLI